MSPVRGLDAPERLTLHITPSERIVLECLAAGAATMDIARRLRVDEEELDAQLLTLFSRMGVRTRNEAVGAAMRRGLVSG